MSQIISTYPIFEGSQVLTSTQLNQLAAYLDQQGRLTRSKLIGMGIVCGMQVQPYPQGLQITKGLGITSEGFLIQAGNFNATHYRPYSLPEGVDYKPFKDVDHAVSLFELLTEIPTDSSGVKKLNNPANFLNDKYVLIFIEVFDKDLKSCLGNACDDRGQDRLLTLRRLVVNGSDLDKILTKSSNVKSPFPSVLDLPEFSVQKPLFYPGKPESNEFGAFVKYYQKFIGLTLTKDFFEALALSYKLFEPILSKSYSFANPLESGTIQDKVAEIMGLAEADPNDLQGIQYLWDFSKEMIKAYSEFRNSAMELWYNCVTDSSLFPLHLMLGRAMTSSETQGQFLKYRHGFVQPPIFNQQKILAETCIQRHRRMIMLLEKLETGIFKKGESEKFPIKITPSGEKLGKLGKRAIPYYYEIKSKSSVSNWFSLEENWVDPGNLQMHSTYRAGVQSYDNQPDEEVTEAKSALETPLFYDIESYPFLRIEGHLSKELKTAVNQIKKLILQFNLPIHVEVLHLGESEETEYLEDCGWNDLQEEYAFQRYFMMGMILELKQLFDYVTEFAQETEEEDITSNEFYKKASEVLSLLLAMTEALPECIKDLNWKTFQNTYKNLLQLLIDFVLLESGLLKEVKADPEKEKELDFYNGILMRLSPILYRILDLFFFTKLQRIYISYENRIQLLKQSNQFAEFLKNHPGLNHEAGVVKDGTFFLLHDPKQNRVIGDFSLPYYCCDCSPCMEPCGEKSFSLPPFARPDYAIAYTEIPIKLEITLNDALVSGRTYEVLATGSSSVHNGLVEKDQETNVFRYTSAPGFTGIDSFQYVLRDKKTNQSDQGKVSILVKGTQGCYSIDVLSCWGVENVRRTLEERKIEAANETDARAVELLLEDLNKTKGFTLDEIRFTVMEGTESRIQLLKCLGYQTEGMSYEELERAILDHQGKNCGAIVTPECTSLGVKGVVNAEDGSPLIRVRVRVKKSDIETTTDSSGNYEIQFQTPGQTLVFERNGFESQEVEICNQSEANITLVRSENPVVECYSINIISTWKEDFIRKVAKDRQLENPSGNLPDVIQSLLESLRETKGFTSTELRETTLNDPDLQKFILESVGMDTSSMKPEQYAAAIEYYQTQNCGFRNEDVIVVTAANLPEEELKKYLDAKKVAYLPGADKTVLVETFKASTPESTISRKDLEIFKKDTLLKISEEKSIEVNSSDTKAKLIDKLMGK
ncbi:carboxypeptidase-like regulatory domain-containing protein [Algoriphagus halophytocola]|uniref:Ig-like domain-containing protein n=1 Tax=Algoriphagus halophytocola TaxID=2991499 RepID=UPI0022DD50BE|nr:carboxypeptidase-like regulatory domain-containing protein [Algoriphagus sp. TR-M9]WBL42916.1 carboxypeptidase-like regulatory domain-containing protein [Algoriphagus sp. TR-M9]